MKCTEIYQNKSRHSFIHKMWPELIFLVHSHIYFTFLNNSIYLLCHLMVYLINFHMFSLCIFPMSFFSLLISIFMDYSNLNTDHLNDELKSCCLSLLNAASSAFLHLTCRTFSEWHYETIDDGKMFLKHVVLKPRPPWACQSSHLAHLWNVPNCCLQIVPQLAQFVCPSMFKTLTTKISSWWIILKILCLSICYIMVNLCLIHNHKLGTLVSVVCQIIPSDYRPMWHFNSFQRTGLDFHMYVSPFLSDVKV